jgi:hypothetical protein
MASDEDWHRRKDSRSRTLLGESEFELVDCAFLIIDLDAKLLVVSRGQNNVQLHLNKSGRTRKNARRRRKEEEKESQEISRRVQYCRMNGREEGE